MENARVRVYWLPLGAGGRAVGRAVARNGRLFEAWVARREHRSPCELYHAALQVEVGSAAYVVEMAPAWSRVAEDRGVVATGPVGLRWLGRSALFRYEVRRWREGVIPDLEYAVGGPVLVRTDSTRAVHLLALVPLVPGLTWGRDELGLGEMWNSNSLVAWLLAGSGHDVGELAPPAGGRAPGWAAGLRLVRTWDQAAA
ncbi:MULTISPECIES: hypothetical protein [unclassified Nocardioides]|uniref:hypothetical protein n=1 Tax=unclassified Nocardioides TaxID=2615069 RepID=UPI0000571036|nr:MULTISPECIES: hypothetical protein [unclassified Nocardioides]ABL80479.1 hypothetical protein Noca_0956 [Nocardioides sp. JS614]